MPHTHAHYSELNFVINFFPHTDLSHLDSQPGTPMSVESANSEASKVRLKIKVKLVLRFAALSSFYLFYLLICSTFLGLNLNLNGHLPKSLDNSYVFDSLSMV